MRKQVTFLVAALMVFAITLTAFFAGCGGGDSGSGGNNGSISITVPKVGDLPKIPEDANPAETVEDVDSILRALAQSSILRRIPGRMEEVIYDNTDHSREDRYFFFTDKKDDDKTVIVSASGKRSYEISDNYRDYYFYGRYDDVRLTTSDYYRYSSESTMKGKTIDDITKDITEENVTIIAGCTIGEQHNESENVSVTKAGTRENARGNYSGFYKSQYALGFTVKTSLGSVKVIVDLTYNASVSGSNALLDDVGSLMGEVYMGRAVEQYSGSLKVYGKDDALLRTVLVTNRETFSQVQNLIGYNSYWYW